MFGDNTDSHRQLGGTKDLVVPQGLYYSFERPLPRIMAGRQFDERDDLARLPMLRSAVKDAGFGRVVEPELPLTAGVKALQVVPWFRPKDADTVYTQFDHDSS